MPYILNDFEPEDVLWRPIDYYSDYWISDTNRVFNIKRGTLISPFLNTKNVLCVRLYKDGKATTLSVNKLRIQAFTRRMYHG